MANSSTFKYQTPYLPGIIYGQSSWSETIEGTQSGDWIIGGAGYDKIYAYGGDDRIYTGNYDYATGRYTCDGYNSLVFAGLGRDFVYGGNGMDWIFGEGGDDDLYGYANSDRLDGGAGRDKLVGGIGNDYLIGGSGNDTLKGGEGTDTYYFSGGRTDSDFIYDNKGESNQIIINTNFTNCSVDIRRMNSPENLVIYHGKSRIYFDAGTISHICVTSNGREYKIYKWEKGQFVFDRISNKPQFDVKKFQFGTSSSRSISQNFNDQRSYMLAAQ